TKVRKTRFDEESWDGVDRGLFEHLRKLRREIADDRGVPPFILFSDATLRDMARLRPSTSQALLRVRGGGGRKVQDLGPRFLKAIESYCNSNGLKLDDSVHSITGGAAARVQPRKPNDSKVVAFEMFTHGKSIDYVVEQTGRARSTVCGYLVE